MSASNSFLKMRRRNVEAVVATARTRPGISRAEISKRTGLSKATVSHIVDELLKVRFLEEVGVNTRSLGRPSIGLRFNARSRYCVGIWFAEERLSVSLCDLDGKPIFHGDLSVRKKVGAEHIVHALIQRLAQWLSALKSSLKKVCSVGVAAPGPISRGQMSHEGWWQDCSWTLPAVIDCLRKELKVPVLVESSTDMAAVAILRNGSVPEHGLVMVVRMAHQIRCAFAVDGFLLKGTDSLGGELGEIIVPAELASRIKKGRHTINDCAATNSLLKTARERGLPVEFDIDLLNLVTNGSLAASSLLAEAGSAVGYGIAIMLNVLAPSTVVLSGPLLGAGDALVEPLRLAVRKYSLASHSNATQILISKLTPDSESLGAALSALSACNLFGDDN